MKIFLREWRDEEWNTPVLEKWELQQRLGTTDPSQMALYSLHSALFLTRSHRALVKSSTVYREYGATWDVTQEQFWFVLPNRLQLENHFLLSKSHFFNRKTTMFGRSKNTIMLKSHQETTFEVWEKYDKCRFLGVVYHSDLGSSSPRGPDWCHTIPPSLANTAYFK
jgi:hypothetical protein